MSKHERMIPSTGQTKWAYQSQVRSQWGKVPLFTQNPLHKEMRTLELAALDANSVTATDYKVYLQLKDKIISMSADSLIT